MTAVKGSPLLSRLMLTALLGCSLISQPLHADSAQDRLQQIKSAFVFNIAKFVQWHEDTAQTPLTLCHYRINILQQGFQSVQSKTIQGRPLAASMISDLTAARGCDLLFIPRDQMGLFNAQQWLIRDQAILTIADLTGIPAKRQVESRAIINLVRQGARVGLEINLPELRKNPLHISSELLKLARVRR